MKKKIRTYLFLGTAIALVVPIAAVLSCGSQNHLQKANQGQFINHSSNSTDGSKGSNSNTPGQAIVYTDDFFKAVNASIRFNGASGDIFIDDNATLNAGLQNATLQYGWSMAQGTQPTSLVSDYHEINNLKNDYMFWIFVTPNQGAVMGEGQQTTASMTVTSYTVSTLDFFSDVSSTIKFYQAKHVLVGNLVTGDNQILNQGVLNASVVYGWSDSDALPSAYVSDYHTLNNLKVNYYFYIKVVPNVGHPFTRNNPQVLVVKVVES